MLSRILSIVFTVFGLLGKNRPVHDMTIKCDIHPVLRSDMHGQTSMSILNDRGALHYAVGFRCTDQVAGWMAWCIK